MALWGIFVVGLVDNVLKPFLVNAGMEMRSGVVFFSLIGGLSTFGAIGLVIGPMKESHQVEQMPRIHPALA